MKKILGIGVLVIVIVVILVFVMVFSTLTNNIFYQEYQRLLPQNTVEEKLYDDHGGFALDGISLYKYNFDENGAKNFITYIQNSKDWRFMPLPDDLITILYGKDNYNYKYGEKTGLPKIKNGYYMYKQYRKGNYLECHNFSLSIYDSDNDILYLLKVKI